jgi:glutamyl/glutaminyl-tRNA synthetase
VTIREPSSVRRVRFARSPTGTLHIGNALPVIANGRFGDRLLLRIDDTDPARNVPGGEEAIVADLEWLGVSWLGWSRSPRPPARPTGRR